MTPIGYTFAGIMLVFIYSHVIYYLGYCIYRFLRITVPPDIGVRPLFIVMCVIYVLFVALGFVPINKRVRRHFVRISWILLGFAAYLIMFFALSDFIRIIMRASGLNTLSDTFEITRLGSAIIITAIFTILGLIGGRHLALVYYDITFNSKHSEITELRIALLADIHLGHLNSAQWLDRIIDMINRAEPDIVCIAGDIFTDNYKALTNALDAEMVLKSIKSKYGVYAALGNHDSGKTYMEMLDFLKRCNIIVLQDEHIIIDNRFIVLGRTDPTPMRRGPEPRSEVSIVLNAISAELKNLPVIVIDHQPNYVSEYGTAVDLVLSGHTHGGSFFPGTITTRFTNKISYGHKKKDANSPDVVVTSGAGVSGPPFRLGSKNEVVLINCKFEYNDC